MLKTDHLEPRAKVLLLITVLLLISLPVLLFYVYKGGIFKTRKKASLPPPPLDQVHNDLLAPQLAPQTAGSPSNPLGEQKTLVIMYNFQNDPDNKPYTTAEVETTFFASASTADSLNSYYREVSYAKTWFTGTVAGWYTVPVDDSNPDSCAGGTYEAREIARQNGIDVDSFPRHVFLTPFRAKCGPPGGSASTGGNPSETNLNGTIDQYSLRHELGHNLSLGHAHSLSCGTKAIDRADLCAINSYGDIFSLMGSPTAGRYHHHAFHKLSLGWINPERVTEIAQDSTVSLLPLELESASGTQIIKIPKPDTDQYYYLEYRQPVGSDQSLPSEAVSGATVRVGFYGTSTIPPYTYEVPESYLIDTTPGSPGGFSDSPLTDGASFVDEVNNITITQNSHNSSSVNLTIAFSLPSPTPTPTSTPSPTPSPTPTTAPADFITVNADISLKGTAPKTEISKKLKFQLTGPASFTTDTQINTSTNGNHSISVDLPAQINPGPGYAILLKASHHLARKITQVSLPDKGGSHVFDFTQFILLPGDLNSDGRASSDDLNLVRDRLSLSDTAETSVADVNYDGVVSGADLILVRRAVELGLTDEL